MHSGGSADKALATKHEDQSADPQRPHQKAMHSDMHLQSNSREVEIGGSLNSLVRLLSHMFTCALTPGSVRESASNSKVRIKKKKVLNVNL